jgi:hypothetical protein
MTTTKIEIEVSLERIENEIASRVKGELDDSFARRVDVRLDQMLEERLRQLTDARLAAALDKALAEGWVKTDGYGRAKNENPTTLKTIVLEYLTKGDYQSPLDRIFREVVDKALTGELFKLLEEAKAKLRLMLDKTIADKLRAVVTEAIR